MTVHLAGSSYGVELSFTVVSELAPKVVERLPPGWQPGPVADDAPCWTVTSPHDVIRAVSEAELHVAEMASGLVFVHAGVTAFDGVAIVLPGRSLSGKSTLVHALVRAGATYYSDEFAVLEANGRVLPYARPITLRASPTSAAQLIPPEQLGDVGTDSARVGLVAHLQYRSESRWDVRGLSGAECTLALIDNAVAAQLRSDEVLAHCAATARSGRGVSGNRGEAEHAVAELRAMLVDA